MNVRYGRQGVERPQNYEYLIGKIDERPFLYIVNRPGPAVFHIKDDGKDSTFKVTIGSHHTCTCQKSCNYKLCIHILFVMLKILKIPKESHLSWHMGFNDREMEMILSNSMGIFNQLTKMPDAQNKQKITRKDIKEEDDCPICHNNINTCNLRELVYCQNGCGRNIHGQCMKLWSQHQIKSKKDLTCPLCRCNWGKFSWIPPPLPPPPPSLTASNNQNTSIKCSNCKGNINDKNIYECRECHNYRLCINCFKNGIHMQHKFPMKGKSNQMCQRLGLMLQCSAISLSPNNS